MSLARPKPRLLLFLATTTLVLAAAWRARGALLPFFLGLGVAYLIAPLVTRVEASLPAATRRRRFSRALAIMIVYLVLGAVLAGAFLLLVPPIVNQAAELVAAAPDLDVKASERTHAFVEQSYRFWPQPVQAVVESALAPANLQRMGLAVLGPVKDWLVTAFGAVTDMVFFLVGLLIVPIWLVYILSQSGQVIHGALGLVPSEVRPDVEAVRIIFDRVLSAYIRGQLIVALMLGTLMTIALTLLGVPYGYLLGAFAGSLAIIPFLGTFVGTATAVGVAWLQSPDLAVRTLLAFLAIQQVDNIFISPRVQGRAVQLNPALVMVVLVGGQYLIGPLGLLISVPLAAIFRDIVNYVYLRIGEKPLPPVAALTSVGYGKWMTAVMRGEAGEEAGTAGKSGGGAKGS